MCVIYVLTARDGEKLFPHIFIYIHTWLYIFYRNYICTVVIFIKYLEVDGIIKYSSEGFIKIRKRITEMKNIFDKIAVRKSKFIYTKFVFGKVRTALCVLNT